MTSPLWLTPLLQEQRSTLERLVSHLVEAPVHIDRVAALPRWRPGLVAYGVTISGRHGTAVQAQAVRIELSWLALLRGRVRPARISLIAPELALVQTAHGFHIAGLVRHHKPAFHWRAFLRSERSLAIWHGRLELHLISQRTSVDDLNAQWQDGLGAGVLHIAATIPGVCVRCHVQIDLYGTHWRLKPFTGAVGLRATHLVLNRLHSLFPEVLTQPWGGQFEGQVWTVWKQGQIHFVGGEAAVQNARFPMTLWTRPISFTDFSGKFSYQKRVQGFRLYGGGMRLQGGGVVTRMHTLYVSQGVKGWQVSADRLNVQQLSWLVAHIRHLPKKFAPLVHMQLKGQLLDVAGYFRGRHHFNYGLAAHFFGLGLRDGKHGLRFAHVAGSLRMKTHSGHLMLSGLHGLVRGPAAFSGPFHVVSAKLKMQWQRAANGLSVQVPAFDVVTADGAANGALTVVAIQGHSPVLELGVHMRSVQVAALSRYYPKTMPRHLRAWLGQTLRAGVVTDGHVILKGPLNRFPFRHGGGLFVVNLHATGVRYRFLPRWLPARHVQGIVAMHDATLTVRGQGQIGGVPVQALTVQATPLGSMHGQVRVHAQMQGQVQSLLKIVLPHVHAHLRSLIPATLAGAGQGRVTLHLNIPFNNKMPLHLKGQLALVQASLFYPFKTETIPFTGLQGTVDFAGRGPTSGRITGYVLGGKFGVALATHAKVLTVRASGYASAPGLKHIDGPLRPYISGSFPWHLQLVAGKVTHLTAQANLRAVTLRAPFPLGKAVDVPAVAHFAFVSASHMTTATGQITGHGGVRIIQGSGPTHVWVGIGDDQPPASFPVGMAVDVRSPYLNVSQWIPFIEHLVTHVDVHHRRPVAVGAVPLTNVGVRVGSLSAFGRLFGAVRARFHYRSGLWTGIFRGPDVDGNGRWRLGRRPDLILSFDRLVIPTRLKRNDTPAAPIGTINPRHLPAVHFFAQHLVVGSHHFGRVLVQAAPSADGWRFVRFALIRPHTTLSGVGQWTLHDGAQETVFSGVLKSHDLGHTLGAWGLPHQVAGGHAVVHAGVNWPGSPFDFGWNALNASVKFVAWDGRFLNIKQGAAGKLLGIFNVDSITRYLTFNFSNIVHSGFSFARIGGRIIVERGLAVTHGISINGAPAQIGITGSADLNGQTFDLLVRVSPHLANNLTLASGLLGGPIAGAAVLLMQKIFAQEINKGTQTTYVIKGPWRKPYIHKQTDKD